MNRISRLVPLFTVLAVAAAASVGRAADAPVVRGG